MEWGGGGGGGEGKGGGGRRWVNEVGEREREEEEADMRLGEQAEDGYMRR